MAKKYTWYRLPELFVTEREIAVLDVESKHICLTLYEGQYYAFAYKCPHASGLMADGFVDDSANVVCPLHRYRFSIKNGFNTSGEGFHLKTYPIEVRDGGVYLGLEKTGLFGW
jgi:nitrite reductase/ring-hydroxylating ferredoxin subunit